MPEISVLVPVRNAGAYLGPSLRSLTRQSFADLEIVAVNDGSTDGSGEALERFAAREPRLRVLHTDARGLPLALNSALAAARGRLIARHDADDVSHRRRLELQRQYLERHPGVAVVGCRLRLFPGSAVGAGMRRWARWHNSLLAHDDMARELLIDSPLAHGTSMMRRVALERVGGWRDRGWAEDLDLWVRMIEAGVRFAKRPETLYGWRQHRASATRKDPRYGRQRFVDLKLDALARGILRRRNRVTLVGVGESLERGWRGLQRLSLSVEPVSAGSPAPRLLDRLEPPIVLVFMAPAARERWRAGLVGAGMCEGSDFVFVA